MLKLKKQLPLLLAVLLAPFPAFAEVNSGDTSWMMISTALVLLMTPGLAFFYAGMVRSKNAASTLSLPDSVNTETLSFSSTS